MNSLQEQADDQNEYDDSAIKSDSTTRKLEEGMEVDHDPLYQSLVHMIDGDGMAAFNPEIKVLPSLLMQFCLLA